MPDPTPKTARSAPPPEKPPSRWRVEGGPNTPATTSDGNKGKRKIPFGIAFWVLMAVLLAVNWIVSSHFSQPPSRPTVSYTFFVNQVKDGNVANINSTDLTVEGTFKTKTTLPQGVSGGPSTTFKTEIPTFVDNDSLNTLLDQKKVVINAKSTDQAPPFWEQVLLGFGPTLLFVGIFVLIMRRASAGNALGSFGRSRAKRYEESEQRVTFADAAGIDEAVEELAEVVDFLRNPTKYTALGARVPEGRAALRAARHRQDAPCPRGGG